MVRGPGGCGFLFFPWSNLISKNRKPSLMYISYRYKIAFFYCYSIESYPTIWSDCGRSFIFSDRNQIPIHCLETVNNTFNAPVFLYASEMVK